MERSSFVLEWVTVADDGLVQLSPWFCQHNNYNHFTKVIVLRNNHYTVTSLKVLGRGIRRNCY